MEEKGHSLQMIDRKELFFKGILSVVSFCENAVELDTTGGFCQITGRDLHIEKLDLEKGEVILKGFLNSLYYPDEQKEKDKTFFKRLFS